MKKPSICEVRIRPTWLVAYGGYDCRGDFVLSSRANRGDDNAKNVADTLSPINTMGVVIAQTRIVNADLLLLLFCLCSVLSSK